MTGTVRDGATPVEVIETDILIVGSGMGGATLAYGLKDSGRRVLIVERGERLPREPQNSDPTDVHVRGRYKNAETWYNGVTGAPFTPGLHYWVGGNTKLYGASLPRFRASDFEETRHQDGISPAWPFRYDELEPYYGAAEAIYTVHGSLGEDPTEPAHSAPYPHPALEHEPTIAALADSLTAQGLHPFHMATGMTFAGDDARAACATCDGAPCETGAKADAENCALDPALESDTVDLMTGIRIDRLETSADGSVITGAIGTRDGRPVAIRARTYVLSAGAVNSAVILLRSTSEAHPDGLSNSSGLVGRNYMVHNSTFVIAVDPRRSNATSWQKTLGLNDWYESGRTTRVPLGNVQMLGKLREPMLRNAKRWVPKRLLKAITQRSVDLYLTTEDLPRTTNGIRLIDDAVHVWWTTTNSGAHRALVRRVRRAVRRAGYPIALTQRMGIATNSHQCGTMVAGTDPATSVLDPDCRSHEVGNLWVVDSSFFPSSAALNPALTIAANALRVAEKIARS